MSDLPDTENGDKGSYAAPALEKGLDILELLAEVGEPLSTREIAERLARSKSEIFRMVFVLQQRGYLAREAGTDRLGLSRRLFDLGIRTPAGRQLTSIVLPVMERFSEASGQVAHLVVLSRAQTVVLATTSGHLDASVIVRPGYGRPALDANSGLLILAFQSETRRRQLMREASDADKQRLEAAATERSFAEIRALGHRVAASRDIMAVTDIACPVIGPAAMRKPRSWCPVSSGMASRRTRRRSSGRSRRAVRRPARNCRYSRELWREGHAASEPIIANEKNFYLQLRETSTDAATATSHARAAA